MNLFVIDIGGSTIKYATWMASSQTRKKSLPTPNSWKAMKEQFIAEIKSSTLEFSGVAISSPGSVDTQAGIIYGLSAIEYIHRFEIKKELEQLFGLPVSIKVMLIVRHWPKFGRAMQRGSQQCFSYHWFRRRWSYCFRQKTICRTAFIWR